jgi:hypothetical protein
VKAAESAAAASKNPRINTASQMIAMAHNAQIVHLDSQGRRCVLG